MMQLNDVWPLFGLTIESPRLTISPVQDDDLPELCRSALNGIHDPQEMPFGVPWTDAAPDELLRKFAAFQWSLRAKLSADDWTISFAVRRDGRAIGVMDLRGERFNDRRVVETGSWLTQDEQGSGLGTELRTAVLLFAFDRLEADIAESSAAVWNRASLRVSEKLGYRPNGFTRVASRPGEPQDEQRLILHRDNFIRPDWSVVVRGTEAARAQLGIRSRKTSYDDNVPDESI